MMRCLVVDDDPVSRAVLERLIAKQSDLELVGVCASAAEAGPFLRAAPPPDLLFLDVEMPEMSGLDLIRSVADLPEIVLVTGNRDYAVEAFEVEVADYVVKPVTPARFLKALERARARLRSGPPGVAAGGEDPRHLFARIDGKLVRIAVADIHRVEARGDYVLIHTAGKRHMVHATMKAIEQRLPAADFVRVHRSHIVRIDQIVDVEEGTLVVDRQVIPIGDSYRSALFKRLRTL